MKNKLITEWSNKISQIEKTIIEVSLIGKEFDEAVNLNPEIADELTKLSNEMMDRVDEANKQIINGTYVKPIESEFIGDVGQAIHNFTKD